LYGKSIYQSQAAVLQARREPDVLHEKHTQKRHAFILIHYLCTKSNSTLKKCKIMKAKNTQRKCILFVRVSTLQQSYSEQAKQLAIYAQTKGFSTENQIIIANH